MLSVLICRMGLSGKYDLDRFPAIKHQRSNTDKILKDQRCAFVAGKPAREADRQRIRIEEGSHGDHLLGIHVIFRPSRAGTLANEGEHLSLQELMNFPHLFVGNVHDSIPEWNVVVALHPLFAEITIEQETELRRDPRWSMHAVGDGGD